MYFVQRTLYKELKNYHCQSSSISIEENMKSIQKPPSPAVHLNNNLHVTTYPVLMKMCFS